MSQRLIHKSPALPARWRGIRRLIALEANLTPTPRGRLAAKLLVFRTAKDLQAFWRDMIGEPVGRRCVGVVHALMEHVEKHDRKGIAARFVRADPRFFCVIGLCVPFLDARVISHESVHAGFCYAKRVKRDVFGQALDLDEELVAYPAGEIANLIARACARKGLLK